MPRIFTGLEIPLTLAPVALAAAWRPARRALDRPRELPPDLRFIGDVDDQTELEVASLLGRVRRSPFELRFDMPVVRRRRAARGRSRRWRRPPALMELQAEHERLMQRIGLEPEGANTRRHVTLARLRELVEASRSPTISATRALIRPLPFTVSRISSLFFAARSDRRRAAMWWKPAYSAGGLCDGCGSLRRGIRCGTPQPRPCRSAIRRPGRRRRSSAIRRRKRVVALAERARRAPARASARRANRRRSAGCSARATASRSRSRGSTSTARSAAARPC